MMNSLFHGFENGTLSGEILITAQLQNDYLHLKYTDTGKGMSQETAEKIFEPFFTTRRGYGGSGLGMYICYNLVTSQLHGTISCVSSPGNGVTFFIDYPVQTSQPPISEY
jgi:signal transduction histidine kinase